MADPADVLLNRLNMSNKSLIRAPSMAVVISIFPTLTIGAAQSEG